MAGATKLTTGARGPTGKEGPREWVPTAYPYRVGFQGLPQFSTDHGYNVVATYATLEDAVERLDQPFGRNKLSGGVDVAVDPANWPSGGWRRVAGRKRGEATKVRRGAK